MHLEATCVSFVAQMTIPLWYAARHKNVYLLCDSLQEGKDFEMRKITADKNTSYFMFGLEFGTWREWLIDVCIS